METDGALKSDLMNYLNKSNQPEKKRRFFPTRPRARRGRGQTTTDRFIMAALSTSSVTRNASLAFIGAGKEKNAMKLEEEPVCSLGLFASSFLGVPCPMPCHRSPASGPSNNIERLRRAPSFSSITTSTAARRRNPARICRRTTCSPGRLSRPRPGDLSHSRRPHSSPRRPPKRGAILRARRAPPKAPLHLALRGAKSREPKAVPAALTDCSSQGLDA